MKRAIVTATPAELNELYIDPNLSNAEVFAWDWGLEQWEPYGATARVDDTRYGTPLYYTIPVKYLQPI